MKIWEDRQHLKNIMIRALLLLFTILAPLNLLAAVPQPWQISFQPPATEIMEDFIWLHDFLMLIMTGIILVVLGLLTYICVRFSRKNNPVAMKFTHNAKAEIIWTLIPVLILCIIAIPSFKLLKKAETIPPAELTVKVIGYQWYWGYEYPDHGGFSFDSYMIPQENLKAGDHRLLEVDNRIVIPENTVVRFLITSADVIHSFAVPSFGIKTDAVPGRINETWVKVKERGVYYGQCSELCGVNHGFMPIAVQVVSKEEFANWVEEAKTKFAQSTLNKFLALKQK